MMKFFKFRELWFHRRQRNNVPQQADLLDLRCAGLSDEKLFKPVLRKLQKNEHFKTVDLFGNSLADGVVPLAIMLSSNKSIRSLKLDQNRISCANLTAIAVGLATNSTIEECTFDFNEIGPAGAKAFAKMLCSNQSIKKVSFRHNRIGSDGAEAFGKMLRVNKTIKRMTLRGNGIGNRGAIAIMKGLKENTSVEYVCLSFNEFQGTEVAVALRDLLVSNHTIKVFRLWDNAIGNGAMIANGLAQNRGLESLYLGQNDIDDDGATALAGALKTNKSLKTMCLYQNEIGAKGAKALASGLELNFTLENLQIDGYEGDDEHETPYCAALSKINHLLRLNVSGRENVYMNDTSLPHSLWAYVFARVSEQPDVLNSFLQAKPDLFIS